MAHCCWLQEPMLGTFPFSSKTSPGIVTRHQGKCIAHIFVMHVAEELEMWPEREERQRFWVSWRCGFAL